MEVRMLQLYNETKFQKFDLSQYNIRYVSIIDDKIVGIFIARFSNNKLYDIQTYMLPKNNKLDYNQHTYKFDKSFAKSKDLIIFCKTIHEQYKPTSIEFKIYDNYAKNLAYKVASKYGYKLKYVINGIHYFTKGH